LSGNCLAEIQIIHAPWTIDGKFWSDWPSVATSVARPFRDPCGAGIINAGPCPRELGRVPPFRLAAPRRFDRDSIFQHLDELDTERLDGR
jgi:hypothetical protein